MAQIHNTDLTKELKEGAKLQQLRDVIPSQLADKVVPVMEVNPKLLRRLNLVKVATRTSSGGVTIFTSDTDRDTFITNIVFSLIKDATCDMANVAAGMTLVINGLTTNIAQVACLTLTAQNSFISITLEAPLKIDRGTAVAIAANTFTVGSCVRVANVYGYTVENINA